MSHVFPGRDRSAFLPRLASSLLLAAFCAPLQAADAPSAGENYNAWFQSTYVWQKHPGFDAAYTGDNSLTPRGDKSYTLTATAYLGYRPWQGGELYLNGELVQGYPFTGTLVGFGANTNGEFTKAADTFIKGYFPRFFLRQTWNLGGEKQAQESGANQLAGELASERFVLSVGKFSILDIFDNNAYAKDPRTQFGSVAHMSYTAYDYASDARGYGWGVVGEWYQGDWAVRLGRITGPQEPNGSFTDYKILKHYGDQLEFEHAHRLYGQPGKLRLLLWRNRGWLASFDDALAYGNAVGWVPDPVTGRQYIVKVRRDHVKYGAGINAEQALGNSAGAFLRAMWADGATETMAFNEADLSLSTGVAVNGAAWQRPKDTLGVSGIANGISAARRAYLAAGGIAFFIGDGALNYRPEQTFETYYSIGLGRSNSVTLDYQRIVHPGYNADRGPANVFGARLHLEY